MPYTLKAASEIIGCSVATLRRRIKAGQLAFTIEETQFGKQYMIPDEAVHPSAIITDMVQVERTLTLEQFEQVMHRLLTESISLAQSNTVGMGDEMAKLGDEIQGQGDKIDQLQQQIVELKTIIEQQSRKELPAPWWKRIIKRKEKDNG